VARTEPWLGVPLAFVALTLAGFPPAVIGLVTKYVVLRPVVDDGLTWLAVVMAVNVMLGLAYYLRLVVVLVSRPAEASGLTSRPAAPTAPAVLVVATGTAILCLLSILPGFLIDHLP
jgi:NADH-quinone oxidoreductase subunit N